jgi:hypothetical protein
VESQERLMPAAIAWTAELEDAICNAIAITPKGLEHICSANPDFPCADKIYERRRESQEFGEKYTRAKADQVMVLADQIVDIADDGSQDETEIEITPGVKSTVVNREIIERSKIRIDARKWLAGKLAPKIFGDKLTHEGEIGIKTVIVPATQKSDAARPAASPSFDEE